MKTHLQNPWAPKISDLRVITKTTIAHDCETSKMNCGKRKSERKGWWRKRRIERLGAPGACVIPDSVLDFAATPIRERDVTLQELFWTWNFCFQKASQYRACHIKGCHIRGVYVYHCLVVGWHRVGEALKKASWSITRPIGRSNWDR
jgi:hypothetical protein